MPDQTHTFVETISQPAAGDESTLSVAPAKEPLRTALLDTEARFYRGYSWCLNAYPTLHEVVPLLRQHLNRLDDFDGGWQRAEVMTNVFLLSCAIMDTVDDYLLGERFDFSAVAAVVPGTGPILRAGDFSNSAANGASPKEIGGVGGNVGLLDGSVNWRPIAQMKSYQGSHLWGTDGCLALW